MNLSKINLITCINEINMIISAINAESLKTLKYHTLSIKHLFFLLFAESRVVITICYLKKKNLLRY